MKKILLSALLVFSGLITAMASGHVATAVGVNPSCNGLCNGSATAYASGGIGPYGYTWTGPSGYTGIGQAINTLCAGIYIVTAIDSSDMSTATYTLNLMQPSPVYATANSATICEGTFAAIGVSVTGGTSGYTYLWNPPAGLDDPTSATPLASPVSTTSYTATVTDVNGCTATAVSVVTIDPNPVITVNSVTICAGQSASLTASGASVYSWAPGGMTTSIVNVTPATTTTYTVTGSTAGCIGTAAATVTVSPAPVITLSPTPANCGVCNGAINTSGSGIVAYYWVGPGGYASTAVNPTGLCAGTYTLSATGAGGCTATVTTTVGVSSPVVGTIGSVTASSCGVCDGSATMFATGGVPPYAYTWSTGVTTPTATNLCPGTYTATVTDQNGCSFSVTVTIGSTSTVTAGTSSTPTACSVCNGSANVTAGGGFGSYTYDWFPGVPTGDGTTSISNLCAGSYTVIVTDGSGCTASAVATISNVSPIVITATAMPSVCGACNGTVNIFESGGTGPYLYDLTGYPQQSNGNFAGVCSGALVATVTDANGCSGMYTVFVPSTNTTSFTVSSVLQNESAFGLANGSIDLTIAGTSAPYTFLWSNGASTEDIFSLSGGSYSVTITDNNGDCATYNFNITTVSPYGYITGYAYNDINMNCIFDAGDTPLSGYYVSATSGGGLYYGYTNTSGFYSILAPVGSYTVESFVVANLEAACTNSYSVTVAGGSTTANNNFSYVIPPVYDVCVYSWSNGIVPGFNGYYGVSLYNSGSMPATGVVYLVLPGLLSFVSASPAASSISGDTIFWNYNLIPAYSTLYYSVIFYTPPSAVLGTVATAFVNATVTNGTDINPGCNSYNYSRIITGSFDPNDKTASPSGLGVTGEIPLTETEFSYLIRFQNTGTGPAVNINVTDTLSSMLDPMSFQMLNASHPYTVEMLSGNVIRWKFDNIMLPDSTADEAGSHGYVQFKIAKLNTPSYGQVIENTAYIYFDFNAPVITNTATNTYALPTAIEAQVNESGNVTIYPNPFNDHTTFVIQSDKLSEMYSFELTDVLGKKVKSMNGITDKQFQLSRNGLQNGIYFYKIYTAENLIGIGKVIIK